jgi:hypothetical protein
MANQFTSQSPVWIPVRAGVPFNISVSRNSNWGQRAVIQTWFNWIFSEPVIIYGPWDSTSPKMPFAPFPSDGALLIKGYHELPQGSWYDDRSFQPDLTKNPVDVHFSDDGGPISPNNLVVHIEFL